MIHGLSPIPSYGKLPEFLAARRVWQPSSWRHCPVRQIPFYPHLSALLQVEQDLRTLPAITTEQEILALRENLARVHSGHGVILQAGDCAETFADCRPDIVEKKILLLTTLRDRLHQITGQDVLLLGRIGGQFAKPRSDEFETTSSQKVPVFRGDIVNSFTPALSSRVPDCERMKLAYQHSLNVANLIRGCSQGNHLVFRSHECLLLPYEEALLRQGQNRAYAATSAPFLWIGERTRFPGGGHVEFARGINNPIGVKLGPSATREELRYLLITLNPENTPGRLTLITRLGKDRVKDVLPSLVQEVMMQKVPVIWLCDPMHGNSIRSFANIKTRRFEDIAEELEKTFAVHHCFGNKLHGVHFELSHEEVTECLGGPQNIGWNQLRSRYETMCDPRLNPVQSLALVEKTAELLKKQ